MRGRARLATLLLVVAAAQAQAHPGIAAADVLERYLAALGGRQAFARISTVIMTGTLSGNNVLDELEPGHPPSLAEQHGTFESYWKAPGKRLNVRTVAGYGTSRLGFDGEHAWTEAPGEPPRALTGDALRSIERSSALNPALDWRTLYARVELKGMQKTGGHDAYVIRLVRPDGEAITDFFDSQTFLLLHSESFVHVGERAIKRQIDFQDYREAGGVKFPFRIVHTDENGVSVALTTAIRVNVPLDDGIFRMPGRDGR